MIVVAGEALIDLVPRGTGALAELQPALGGGPYNTAVALGRLGSAKRRIGAQREGGAVRLSCHRAGAVQSGPGVT
ncbi:carbohydrate kinase, partial [Streptomyces sp. NPDC002920]